MGRYVAIFACMFAFRACFKSKTLNNRELLFIGWGGMIRGAIAFALVMKIPKIGEASCEANDPVADCFSIQNYDLMVTTTFAIVVFTTLVFGTFMAMVGRIWVPPKVKEEHDDLNESHHHLIVHPNEQQDLNDTLLSNNSR